MMCDKNHQWLLDLPEGREPTVEELRSSEGDEAVTVRPEPLADSVAVTLVSQGRIVDKAMGRVADDDQILVRVVALSGDERTVGPWPKEKALAWASDLLGCSPAEAFRRLDRLNLRQHQEPMSTSGHGAVKVRATRLASVAVDLAGLVESADPSNCRDAAVAAARFALVCSGLDDPLVSEALQAALDGRFGDTPERSALEELVAALDDRQWALQDQVEAGEVSQDAQLVAFGQARAASAVFFASETNAHVAAAEAIYEATAAVDDLGEVRAVIEPLLS